jgi:hypothetical protein
MQLGEHGEDCKLIGYLKELCEKHDIDQGELEFCTRTEPRMPFEADHAVSEWWQSVLHFDAENQLNFLRMLHELWVQAETAMHDLNSSEDGDEIDGYAADEQAIGIFGTRRLPMGEISEAELGASAFVCWAAQQDSILGEGGDEYEDGRPFLYLIAEPQLPLHPQILQGGANETKVPELPMEQDFVQAVVAGALFASYGN